MKAKDFLNNMIKYCVPSIVSAVLSIAVIPIVSRVFPPEDYGKINMFYSVGNMLMYVYLLGIDSAYIRFYFEEPNGIKRNNIFSMAFWISTVFNICATVIVVFAFPVQVSNYMFGETRLYLLFALSIYVFSLSLFRLLSIETRMEENAFLFNLQQVILIVSNRIAYVVAALVTTNYQFSVMVITVMTMVLGVFFLFRQKQFSELAYKKIEANSLKYILKFAVPLMPTMVMVWINNSAAKFVLSGYRDFNLLGVFTLATSLANVFSLIPSAFTAYWSPFMYKNYKTEQEFIKKVHNFILLFSVLVIVCIFSIQDVVYLIVGEEYRASQKFFMLIMLAPIQTLLCETTSYGIILANKTKLNLYISVAAVAANIGIGYALYPVWGVYGVVAGVVSAALIQLLLKTIIGQKYYSSISKKWKTVFSIALILGLVVSNIWLYDRLFIRLAVSLFVILLCVFLFKEELTTTLRGICIFISSYSKKRIEGDKDV